MVLSKPMDYRPSPNYPPTMCLFGLVVNIHNDSSHAFYYIIIFKLNQSHESNPIFQDTYLNH